LGLRIVQARDLQLLGAASGPSVRVLNGVAEELIDAGQLDTCRQLLDQALSIAAQLGPGHPETLTTRSNLAFLLGEAGQVQQAIGERWTTARPRSACSMPTWGGVGSCQPHGNRPRSAAQQAVLQAT